jgi:diguanylate cyclase (GGDEF)-like protein
LAKDEVEKADVRLAAAVRGAVEELSAIVDDADAEARALARSTRVQLALAQHDLVVLAGYVRDRPGLAFLVRGTPIAGSIPSGAVTRSVAVVTDRGRLGRIVVAIPFDSELLTRLESRVQLGAEESLVLAADGRIVAGGVGQGSEVDLVPGEANNVDLGGSTRRALATPVGDGRQVAATTPRSEIDAAISARSWRVAIAALLTFACGIGVAFLLAPLVLRRFRPAGAAGADGDAREALALVGDAFAATHDEDALPPVILETMIEATGAVGGRLTAEGQELARAGEVVDSDRSLNLELGGDEAGWAGTLILYPPPGGFDRDARDLASWLVTQASVALENARLHAIVKEQAVTDALTGLANRRRFIEELSAEVSRAERFGTPLAVVLADLDDFKSVNDRYGHQAGDDVLRAFAAVLQDRLREIDLPARLGGEEFAILLRQTDAPGARALAEQLRERLADLRLEVPNGDALSVTASFGVASYPSAHTGDELLSAADAALYRAKALGKNRVVEASQPNGSPAART